MDRKSIEARSLKIADFTTSIIIGLFRPTSPPLYSVR